MEKKKEEKEPIFVLLGLIFGYFFKKIGSRVKPVMSALETTTKLLYKAW